MSSESPQFPTTDDEVRALLEDLLRDAHSMGALRLAELLDHAQRELELAYGARGVAGVVDVIWKKADALAKARGLPTSVTRRTVRISTSKGGHGPARRRR